MKLHGNHFIAGQWVDNRSAGTFQATNPAGRNKLPEEFCEAGQVEVDAALEAAAETFTSLRTSAVETRALLLERMANEVESLGDALIDRAHQETGYPAGRLIAERGRATSQARSYAQYIRDGLWRDARIDLGDPDRQINGQVLPKPDVRSHFQALGPAVVFGASNFPIAISVVGADSVGALAAGCPIVVKGHPAHPGTSELLATAVSKAVAESGLPAGIFSMLQGTTPEFGAALVQHPNTSVVAFTGSLRVGRILADLAAARPNPIPFYGELGSVNPVFVLPGAMAQRGRVIAEQFVASLNMGVGQFCTNPGIVLARDANGFDTFADSIQSSVGASKPETMLHPGIHQAFHAGLNRLAEMDGVKLLGQSDLSSDADQCQSLCTVYQTQAENLIASPSLRDEIFGPVSILAKCNNANQMTAFAKTLNGSLTATIHGNEEELSEYAPLIRVLEEKVGRVIFNGFPTGIELCHAMHHGGPYPAATHSGFTSIGTRTISKFGRPVCYQDFPDAALPPELQGVNPLGLSRLVNGKLTREAV
ncbi:MAG: aldehyde dehydrogenase (NADP(+)) [Pirellulaceae bacterium]